MPLSGLAYFKDEKFVAHTVPKSYLCSFMK